MYGDIVVLGRMIGPYVLRTDEWTTALSSTRSFSGRQRGLEDHPLQPGEVALPRPPGLHHQVFMLVRGREEPERQRHLLHRKVRPQPSALLQQPGDRQEVRTDTLLQTGVRGSDVRVTLRGRRHEEKPEVCARVAWSGTGINLRTNRPKPEAVAQAVRAVLADSSYREASSRIGSAIRGSRGVDGPADLVAEVCSGRPAERQ
jgi:hypothetical protein